jgi:hypothetical protein
MRTDPATRTRRCQRYGQAGSDLGCDIWGVRDNGETVCIQCVNRKALTFTKIAMDIAKVLKATNGVPHRFRVVAQSKISAKMRDISSLMSLAQRQGTRYVVRHLI